MNLRRLLVIDDEPAIHVLMESVAAELNLEMTSAKDGNAGLDLGISGNFDFVILDLGLPGMNGTEVCRRLRAEAPSLPILILTSRDDDVSKVLGLELGADDYVTKPFRTPELVARIRAIARRAEAYQSQQESSPAALRIGELNIDIGRRMIFKRGAPIELSRLEFDMLLYLAERKGRVVDRDELMRNVWGYQCSNFDDTITTHLSRIRKKLEEDPSRPRYVLTVRGVGYRIVDDESER